MGLLQKAAGVAPGKGLLKRSLNVLAERTARPFQLLTQSEVDRLFAQPRVKPPSDHKPTGAPANVPLKWAEAGLTAPAGRGPSIGQAEYERLFSGNAHAVAEPAAEKAEVSDATESAADTGTADVEALEETEEALPAEEAPELAEDATPFYEDAPAVIEDLETPELLEEAPAAKESPAVVENLAAPTPAEGATLPAEESPEATENEAPELLETLEPVAEDEVASLPTVEPAAPVPVDGPVPEPVEIKSAPGAEKAPVRAAPVPTEEILAQIAALPQDVELPSRIFAILKEKLSLSKAALLLYDPLRMVYAPWSSYGYDQTSHHRLRIPLGANPSFNSVANGDPVLVKEKEQISTYQNYFSSREHSLIRKVILVPFIAQEKLTAVLLITESSNRVPEEQLLATLKRVAVESSPAIQKAREERLAAAARSEAPAGSLEAELTRILASPPFSGHKVLLASLPLGDYQKKVLAANPYMDPFRLREDLRHFLSNFMADVGRAIPLDKGFWLLATPDLEKRDLDLFLHQLQLYLGSLFGESDIAGTACYPAVFKSIYFPDEAGSAADLVRFFTP